MNSISLEPFQRLIFVFVLLFSLISSHRAASDDGLHLPLPSSLQSWKQMGTSALWWGFWHVYDARLLTLDGRFDERQWSENPVALVINYRRNIKKKSLLSATDGQWAHLGYPKRIREQWLKQLTPIWPDIKKGDQLTFVIKEQKGHFYFGKTFIRKIDDPELSKAFLEIWLSDKTAYPELRKELIGL